ncbi:MAG: S-layer homology domain-containing protein, partial [Clostridia bacterium]|nr:S-layer homology domain-containing protein [Clostridia bacterium]
PERADLSPFSDDEKVSEWANEPLEWAVEAGLIKGTDGNRLAPEGNATREQFAAIIERYDGSFKLAYNAPVLFSHYTEKEYPLVEDADIYVAVTGDDSAAGTKDAPVRTFARAAEMARGKKAEKDSSVVVAFFAGDYGNPDVSLSAEDSGTKDAPVVYCAYGDGDVVFSGGATFSEDDFEPITEEEKANFSEKAAPFVKKADMSVKFPEYTIADPLFSDDGLCTVARWPNKYQDGTDQLQHAGFTPDDNHIRINMSMFTRRILKYHTLEGLYLYGYLTTGWYKDLLLTDGYVVDEETGALDMIIPYPETARMGYLRHEPEFASDWYNATALVNVSEELDAAGEFFVDTAAKTLYVYDPHGSYSFPKEERCVVMDHADYIVFRGLTFTSFRDSMIYARTCHGVTIDLCTVTMCAGDNAVDINGCGRGRDFDISVTNSVFSVFACRPISIIGNNSGANMFSRHGNVEIRNNYFSFTNLTKDDGGAVEVKRVDDAHICHNEFENISRCAIDYGGCKNMIAEYNSFKRCMYNSSDGGVFYSWNSFEDWGNVIRYNVFYPCEWYHVYIDDDEPGTTVSGNLMIDGAVVVHDGRNNSVLDNVLISSYVTITPANREAVEDAIRNDDVASLTTHRYYKSWKAFFDRLDANPEMKAGFEEKYPEVFDMSLDLADVNSPAFVLNPYNVIRGNLSITRTRESEEDLIGEVSRPWCVIEGNTFFTREENPIFVNPTRGDYRIREGADFPDIHFEEVGRY